MFVVAKEREGRFEAAAHSSDFDKRDVIIRCVQGHSGSVVAQMNDIYAHRRIWEPDNFPILLHATKTDLLKHVIGVGRPGLIPGGKCKTDDLWLHRKHIHCATSLPIDGIFPAGFRREGTDCIITLDGRQMHDYKIPMYLSDADVCLVPEAIPIENIKRITLLHDPKLTIYRRPTIAELASCDTDDITCQH